MHARRPVLGICRGHQLLNVWAGGTLQQHVELDDGDGHPRFGDHRGRRCHAVRLTKGSLANRLYGAETTVNSLHHQVVDVVGADLLVSGRSPTARSRCWSTRGCRCCRCSGARRRSIPGPSASRGWWPRRPAVSLPR